jgi:PAS domain-containing protein
MQATKVSLPGVQAPLGPATREKTGNVALSINNLQLAGEYNMERICAWCGKDLGKIKTEPDIEYLISHGICDECAFHLLSEVGLPLREYLDHLDAPVLVVDEDGNVKTANQQAQALLKKDLPAIEDYPGGQVFECSHAQLPEGCGRTIHCSGCTIRRTVLDTLNTGNPAHQVPATVACRGTGGLDRAHYLISTEKFGDVVLLRIDRVAGAD